jgi:hypothetical protein
MARIGPMGPAELRCLLLGVDLNYTAQATNLACVLVHKHALPEDCTLNIPIFADAQARSALL